MIESLKEFINSNESWRYMPSSALKNFIESDSKGLPIDIEVFPSNPDVIVTLAVKDSASAKISVELLVVLDPK